MLVLLAMAPDADYVLRLVSDVFYLRHHRGLTHSLLMLPLWIWLCTSLLPRQRRQRPVMPVLIGTVLLSHILLDLATSFGTMILAPFSDTRFSWDLLFIIDPLFTACLLLPLLPALIWPQRARLLALTAAVASVAYIGLAAYNHQTALRLARLVQPAALQVAALPQPFSPFHWQLIATYAGRYECALVNLFPAFPGLAGLFPASLAEPYTRPLKPAASLTWQQLPAMRAMSGIDDLPGVAFYRWFARFPVLLRSNARLLEFGDLRFGAGLVPDTAFRLRIILDEPPTARLLWHKERGSKL